MVTATNVSFLTVALYLLDLAIKVVALGLVPEGRRPSSASAWLLLILFLPIVGLLAFLLIGSPFVDRGRRRRQAAAGEVISAALTVEADDLLPVPAGSTLNYPRGTQPTAWMVAVSWRQQSGVVQRL